MLLLAGLVVFQYPAYKAPLWTESKSGCIGKALCLQMETAKALIAPYIQSQPYSSFEIIKHFTPFINQHQRQSLLAWIRRISLPDGDFLGHDFEPL